MFLDIEAQKDYVNWTIRTGRGSKRSATFVVFSKDS